MFHRAMAVGASLAMMASVAQAEIISLSAMGFMWFDPTGTSQDPDPDNGSLSPPIGTLVYHGVDFPVNGHNICRFTLVYGDTNGLEGISAKLIRKRIVTGGAVNAAPQTIAAVSSAGIVAGMRRVATTGIPARLIDEVNYFYYVEVNMQNFNTPLVGVLIEHKPLCP